MWPASATSMYRAPGTAWTNSKKIQAEVLERLPELLDDEVSSFLGSLEGMSINLTVENTPFDDDVAAHVLNVGGTLGLDLGHLDGEHLRLAIDYQTARELVLDQNPELFVRAFMMGKIAIDGDMTVLAESGLDPMALMTDLSSAGEVRIDDLSPEAAEIGQRIRAITT